MNKNLLVLGAGQYGIVAKEIAEAMNVFEKIDFLDDTSELAIGKLNDYEPLAANYSYAVVAIGDAELRLKWIQKLEEACFTIAILVHPKAYVSPSAQLMKGTIVEPMAVVQSNSTVAIGCIISSGAVVNHNCFVGDGCHVDCGAVVEAGSNIPAKTNQIRSVSLGMSHSKMHDEYTFECGM